MRTGNREQPIVIDRRFTGLPETAHGGYVAGLIATALGAPSAEVRLRRPAATGRPLILERSTELVELRDGDAVLAEGSAAELSLGVPLPVPLAEAEAASRRYPGADLHLFPDCFGCGPARRTGDGLRIFPGPVAGRRLVAAPWVPRAEDGNGGSRVADELVWAALDCPQLWALIVHASAAESALVLPGTLETALEHPVLVGEPHIVIGWPIGRDGLRWLAGAAVIGPGGELCAVGLQTAVGAATGVPLGWARWRTAHEAHETRR